ncbi:trypsin-like serine protease, partial [Ramicandelaber brevisporus]
DNIIGGSSAGDGEFPSAAHLFLSGWPNCGGTVIGSEWIVTAAHCLANPIDGKSGPGAFTLVPAGQLTVVVGTNAASVNGAVRIANVYPHPQYDPSLMHSDIGLVKLASPIQLGAKVKQAPIFTGSISTGNPLTLAGWGRTDNNGNFGSNTLLKATLTVGDAATCKKGADEYTDSNGQFICTVPQRGEGTCYGDSGGPLFAGSAGSYSLAGAVSFEANYLDFNSKNCAADGTVGFYTRVSQHLGWISSTTG